MEKTFEKCYKTYMNSEDRIRRDYTVIRQFFSDVDWTLSENQQAFLAHRNVFDSLNSQTLMITFWSMWRETGLLKDKNFLIQYLKTSDRLSSAVCDPRLVKVFTRNTDMDVIIDNLDEFIQEVGAGLIGFIFKFGYPFAPGVDLKALYSQAAKDSEFGYIF